MRALKLFLLFIAGLVSSVVLTVEQAFASTASSPVIEDSLVSNLSCQNLTVDSIYRAIRDDAFDESRNLPIRNWAFRHGATPLAGCWGLSSAQRVVSYLARYNESSGSAMSERVASALDMIRGQFVEAAYNVDDNYGQNNFYHASPLKEYHVFAVEESSMRSSLGQGSDSFWNSLMAGYNQQLNGNYLARNFRAEIEASQVAHFFRGGNLRMGMGSGPLSVEENHSTWALLKTNLDQKKLTLINLRSTRTVQHIVMAKSYRELPQGFAEIRVYDSNQPSRDRLVFFHKASGHFYAPDVFKLLLSEPNIPLGVFVVDEHERTALEKALLVHYRSLCRK